MAVAEQDLVLNGYFSGVAYRGGGGAAASTADSTLRSSKSPLSSICRSVIEKFPTIDTKEGRKIFITRSQIVRVADVQL